jgi:MFS family permease
MAYVAIAVAICGLSLSLFVRETAPPERMQVDRPRLLSVLKGSLWSDRGLFSLSQAGLVNNLNDGLAWGLFPLLFVQSGLNLRATSVLAAIYPASWGLFQLLTGALSDHLGRKPLIVAGMFLQGAALIALAATRGFTPWSLALVGLGIGTALVYPTLLAAVNDIAQASWRGVAVGVYRLWRDLGYVVGALLAGVLTDLFGARVAIQSVAILTALSGVVVAVRLKERNDVATAGSPMALVR